jgi:hypothetical protein
MACGLAACTSPVAHHTSTTIPLRIIPAPAHTISLTSPRTDGSIWVLSGTSAEKTISRLDATSGHVQAIVGINPNATDLAESSSGILAVSIGSGPTGSVDLRQGSDGADIATVATSGPATRLAISQTGNLFFALIESAGAESVAEINAQTHALVTSVAVPPTTTDVVPVDDGSSLWALLTNGTVEEFSTTAPHALTMFSTGPSGTRVALSPDGATMYVLRASGTTANLALVALSTQSVHRVIPAPAGATAIAVSLDGRTVYDAATAGTTSDIQAFGLVT